MVAAVRQRVTVQPGGVVEVRSPELTPGASAEVIVLVERATAPDAHDPATVPAAAGASANGSAAAWRSLLSHAGAVDSGDAASADRSFVSRFRHVIAKFLSHMTSHEDTLSPPKP